MGLDPRWLKVIEAGAASVSVGPPAVLPAGGKLERVTVSVPPSVNNLYLTTRDGNRVLTPAGRAWKAAATELLEAMRRPDRYPVTVHWAVNEWLRANRDGANLEKAMVDCLVDAKVLAADDIRHIVGETWSYLPVVGGFGVTVWWEYADPVPEKPKRRTK